MKFSTAIAIRFYGLFAVAAASTAIGAMTARYAWEASTIIGGGAWGILAWGGLAAALKVLPLVNHHRLELRRVLGVERQDIFGAEPVPEGITITSPGRLWQ